MVRFSKSDSAAAGNNGQAPSVDAGGMLEQSEGEYATTRLAGGPQIVVAAAAMVPAMIVQVPSGLAAMGAVLTGVTAADAIVRNETSSAHTSPPDGEIHLNGLPVLLNVVQIGISIGFGLGVAAMMVYPTLKKRSGIMSW